MYVLFLTALVVLSQQHQALYASDFVCFKMINHGAASLKRHDIKQYLLASSLD
jgi:hypothetical protein